MEGTNDIIRLIDTSTIEGEPHWKRKLLICYLLQMCPWAVSLCIFILSSSIFYLLNLKNTANETFTMIYGLSSLCVGVVTVLGFVFAYKNIFPMQSCILAVVFFVTFQLAAFGYLSLRFLNEEITYGFTLTIPFVFLAFVHILITLFLSAPTIISGYSIFIWVGTVILPAFIFIMDEIFDPEGYNHQFFLELIVGTIFFGLFAASWLSALRASFTVQ